MYRSFLVLSFVIVIGHAQEILLGGEFSEKDASTSAEGQFTIIEENGIRRLTLGEDFQVTDGPDLFVLLSPKSFMDATDENADQGAVNLGALQTNIGEQSYEIPASVDLAQYQSVLIHCIEYSHLFGGADFQVPAATNHRAHSYPQYKHRNSPQTVPLDLLGRRMPNPVTPKIYLRASRKDVLLEGER